MGVLIFNVRKQEHNRGLHRLEVQSIIPIQQMCTVHICGVTGSSPVSCVEKLNENPDYFAHLSW